MSHLRINQPMATSLSLWNNQLSLLVLSRAGGTNIVVMNDVTEVREKSKHT